MYSPFKILINWAWERWTFFYLFIKENFNFKFKRKKKKKELVAERSWKYVHNFGWMKVSPSSINFRAFDRFFRTLGGIVMIETYKVEFVSIRKGDRYGCEFEIPNIMEKPWDNSQYFMKVKTGFWSTRNKLIDNKYEHMHQETPVT